MKNTKKTFSQSLRSMLQEYMMLMYTSAGDFDEKRPEEDAETVLHFLQDHLEDFPEGPKVNFIASYLDPSVANPSTVAYYLNPPVDDVTENVIREIFDAEVRMIEADGSKIIINGVKQS